MLGKEGEKREGQTVYTCRLVQVDELCCARDDERFLCIHVSSPLRTIYILCCCRRSFFRRSALTVRAKPTTYMATDGRLFIVDCIIMCVLGNLPNPSPSYDNADGYERC